MSELISINEAAKAGITRLRSPKWTGRFDHILIGIIEGKAASWVNLYSPLNNCIHGSDPLPICASMGGMSYDEQGWLPYTGLLPDSEEYKKEAESYRNEQA